MAKYDALGKFLNDKDVDELHLTFAEIERILGFSLPDSARKFPAWWANDASAGRHASSWLLAGARTERLNLTAETVSFCKNAADKTKPTLRQVADIAPSKEYPATRAIVEFQWHEIGAILREDGELRFPEVAAEAGLYRFRLLSKAGDKSYIGETANVRRRFAHYRKPGPSQATNLRINSAFLEHLAAGGTIFVDLIKHGATVDTGDGSSFANLADKVTRRLLENAALLSSNSPEVENLNL
ncbi:hypothetical protein [Tritonibacter mobilis]|uniref:DUF7662 domain-containing protein n=1 Tax=Tritonibacter mobilis TaxID=379347 RepID=UPI0008068494|nr:hypothetical protein [Tritonibacter mobilis]GLP88066.1 hypothetical protein GCM10007921_36270 [Tritonibacter mobilis]SDX28707.1 hypothetical protein SAMN05444385_106114 [Tritonibacter mobilis]